MTDWERPSLSSGSGPSSGRGGKKKKPGRLRMAFWGVVVVAVVGFAWVSWSAYRSGQNIEDAGMVPLLKADNTPSRIRPDDPGGMNVPNQDKQIYDRIDPKRAAPPGLERLLPPPEQPVGRPAAIPTLHSDDGDGTAREVGSVSAKAIPEPPAPKAVPPAQQVPSPFTKVELPPAAPKGQAAKAPAEKPAPAPQQHAAATPPSTPPAPKASTAKIQLAAVSSEDAAQKEWDRLKKSSGGLLDSVNPAFVRANVGDKVVYRIQAGPLASADAAADLCSKLKARNVGCFVAR
ncbi:MAG TPA: SPOR domain-containing protein [Alphaproteobacteria bacterium]|nr:SPOR domain-containing protein [Alphaproteobacteria bacterium]